MAFDEAYFSSAGGQSKRRNAPQQFTASTVDSRATIFASGWIAAKYARLFSIGDSIEIAIVDTLPNPGALIEIAIARVTSISSTGVVGLSDETFGPFLGGVLRIPVFFAQVPLLAGTTQWMPSPVAGTIKRLVSTVHTQVTTGGVLGLTVGATAAAAIAVPGLAITVADGAVVGTTQSDTPSTTTRVAAGDAIGFTASAGFATAGEAYCVVEIIPDVDNGDVFVPFWCNATDLSAGTSQWWPVPVAGTIVSMHSAVNVAIVTAGGAITLELETVAVTGLSITVSDTAVAGAVQSDTPTSTTTVARGVDLEFVFAAGFDGGGAVNGGVLLRPTNKADTRNRAFSWYSANQTDVLAPTSHWTPNCVRGAVLRGMCATQIAVGTGGNVIPEVNTVAVGGLTVVVANSSAAGDVDFDDALFNDETARIEDAAAIETTFGTAFATTGALNGFWEVQAQP